MSEDANREISEKGTKTEYTVRVFNTVTKKEEEIMVREEVYNEYRRGEWRIKKNESKHMENSIPISSLIVKEGSSAENFLEFADVSHSPEKLLERKFLALAVKNLKSDEQDLIEALFFKEMSTRDYAKRINRSQTWVQRKNFE